MKLKNKRTGEIVEFHYLQSDYISPLVLTIMRNGKPVMIKYNSIAELNADWEDVEEPKEYWFIRDHTSAVGYAPADNNATAKYRKEITGNYFETKEEAEKAVEKLKAWKRLKDKGFEFTGWGCENQKLYAKIRFNKKAWATETEPDLDLLFGGEG